MVVALGWMAGVVTTVAGMGGGMLLTLALAASWGDPIRAIAVATPALLVGNAQRMFLYRRSIAWRAAAPFVAAALPGSLLGGLLAVAVPPLWVQLGMATAAGIAVARHVGLLKITVPPVAMVPLGLGVGLASTAGGAGLLAGPILLSAGLSGPAYLATMSLSSLSMHVGRLAAFGAAGQMDAEIASTAAVLAVCIPLGNATGRWVRDHVTARRISHLEVATAASLVVTALLGVARTFGT